MRRNRFFIIILLLFSNLIVGQKTIGYDFNKVIKEKSCIYYYPEIISTYAPMTTEGIMSNGPYNRVFCKIKPIFFNLVDSILKTSKKNKKGFSAPCTVLKLSYADTALYLTIDSGGNFSRSDVDRNDSLFQCTNKNILLLMEKYVSGFKKYRNRKYIKSK